MRTALRLFAVLILTIPFAPHSLRAQTSKPRAQQTHATFAASPSVRGGKMQTALR